MKSAVAPYARSLDPTLPDAFLPGDGASLSGRSPRGPAPLPPVPVPVISAPLPDSRDTVRDAERRLVELDKEDDIRVQHDRETLDLNRNFENFQTDLARLRERLGKLEREIAGEETGSREVADLIAEVSGKLAHLVEQVGRLRPEEWGRTRMQHELDHAADRLEEVKAEVTAELDRFSRILPDRLKVGGPGWLSNVGYVLVSGFAFLLPLLVVLAIGAILLLTAFGFL